MMYKITCITKLFFRQIAGMEMINQGHFQRTGIKDRLDELHELWELLLKKLSEKGLKLQQVLM